MVIFEIIITITYIIIINISNSETSVDVYCRNKERLIVSDEIDEYLLVDAVIGSTIQLECHFWYL